MIRKLMVMEERIVLDGSVAAAVAAASGAQSGAGDGSADADAPDLSVDPVENNNDSSDSDNDSDNNDNSSDSNDSQSDDGGSDDNSGVADVIAAINEINSNDSSGLKALIINTDISDVNDLIDAVSEGVIVITYDGDTQDLQSVIDQLQELSGGSDYDSIGIITHGEAGAIALTSYEEVTGESLGSDTEQQEFFSALGSMISDDGRIDLISCDSGEGELGDELISAIAAISGVEVTASTDASGNENDGGDWVLEKGDIDAESEYFDGELLDNFDGILMPTVCDYYNPDLIYDDAAGVYGTIDLTFDYNVKLALLSEQAIPSGYIKIVQIGDSDNEAVLDGEPLKELWNIDTDYKNISIDLSVFVSNGLTLIEGAQYEIVIPANTFLNNDSSHGNDEINASTPDKDDSNLFPYVFTSLVNSVVETDTPTHIPSSDIPQTSSGDSGSSGNGDSSSDGLVSDIIAAIEDGNSTDSTLPDVGGDSSEGDNSEGDNSEGDNSEGDGSEGDGSEGENGNTGSSSVINTGASSSDMMVSNPFSELITSQEVQVLFDNTVDAFAQLGMDNPAIFSMIQDAMGDTMTTASLVISCEQCLENANFLIDEVLAMNDEFSLSGGGSTAEGETIVTILQGAIDNVVQARGNALIANDLLRILALNIGDASERLAENSFSAGVRRLAESNEELAFSYEVLNKICKVVKEHKDSGQALSVEQLNGMMPEIISSARSVAGGISENGDRASKDVLAFLTRNMQNEGVDKDNLQQQVAAVFEQWHDSIGVSPVEQMDISLDSDMAEGGHIISEAM